MSDVAVVAMVTFVTVWLTGLVGFSAWSLADYVTESGGKRREAAVRFLLAWAWPLFLIGPAVRLVRTALGRVDDE